MAEIPPALRSLLGLESAAAPLAEQHALAPTTSADPGPGSVLDDADPLRLAVVDAAQLLEATAILEGEPQGRPFVEAAAALHTAYESKRAMWRDEHDRAQLVAQNHGREVIRLSAEVERLAKKLEDTEAAFALLAEPATPEEDRAVAAALRPRFGGPMLPTPTNPGRCVVCDGALEGPVTALGSRPLGRHTRLRDHCPAHGEIVEMNAAKAAKKGNHYG